MSDFKENIQIEKIEPYYLRFDTLQGLHQAVDFWIIKN